jgi:hypothetical protein
MRLLQALLTVNSRRQMAQLATEIARRSQKAVLEKVGQGVRWMSIAETRGYVRARARGILEAAVDTLLPDRAAGDAVMRRNLIDEALERSIVWIVAQKVKVDSPLSRVQRAA